MILLGPIVSDNTDRFFLAFILGIDMILFRATFIVGITLLITVASPLTFAQKPPTPVFVTLVENVDFVDEVEALGTLKSNENVEIMSTVTELVTKINFSDGQRVRKGDILVEMDAAEELAQKVEEESRINQALKQVNRLKSLFRRDAASESALDESERELQTAQARLKAIQSRIDQHILVAPFDGVVGLRNISAGALAQPGTRIATLDDDSVMKLDFSIPEVFIATLKTGTLVQARSGVYPDQVFTGSVSSIDTRIDPVTRSVAVRALLDNPDNQLKAGMLMRVVVQKNPRQTLVIPEESLITSADNNFVLLISQSANETRVKKQAVTLGSRRKGEVEILAGIKPGQQVVTHGITRAKPGAAVVIKAVEKNNESLSELLQQNINKKAQ
ncbi:MAG: efflux RND transporter periplasmic adaptor subunit [Pseudomonadota bacterium]